MAEVECARKYGFKSHTIVNVDLRFSIKSVAERGPRLPAAAAKDRGGRGEMGRRGRTDERNYCRLKFYGNEMRRAYVLHTVRLSSHVMITWDATRVEKIK